MKKAPKVHFPQPYKAISESPLIQKAPALLKTVTRNPKISVIVTSYNLLPYLKDTLYSVLNQKYSDYEIIVVDGASTDGSVEFIKKLSKKYHQIRFLSEKDTGYPDAFWKALRMAKGRYILQCAVSDAYANPDWLSLCAQALDNNEDISLVWGFPQYIDETGNVGDVSYPEFHSIGAPSRQNFFYYWLNTGFVIPEGNLCVRKSVIERCYPQLREIKTGILDWLEFNARFNLNGYLTLNIPVVANYGRIHLGQAGNKYLQSGIMARMFQNYQDKRKIYIDKLLKQGYTHTFINYKNQEVLPKQNPVVTTYVLTRAIVGEYVKNILKTYQKVLRLVVQIMKSIKLITKLVHVLYFANDLIQFYWKYDHKKRLRLSDLQPCLDDKTVETGFDRHYIYFPAWAIRTIKKINPAAHVDIASSLTFCTMISAYIPTTFYDYRPAKLNLSGLSSSHADITKLPFKNGSIKSLSCMHVLEHIGLGRYGDPIDPRGDIKGTRELKRVLATGGYLLLVVPVGKDKVKFNAHRIYSYKSVMKLFSGLTLVESYLIPDDPNSPPLYNPSQNIFNQQIYGCGCFLFKKEMDNVV